MDRSADVAPPRTVPGTIDRPLYHWHLPKTAGSSLVRVLKDAFTAEELIHIVPAADWRPDRDRPPAAVICGHLGPLPPALWPGRLATFTVLREPVARAWSQWRYMNWKRELFAEHLSRRTRFRDLARTPRSRHLIGDYQALWLTSCAQYDSIPSTPLPSHLVVAAAQPSETDLRGRALRALAGVDLVGTTERLPETVDVLSRFLGRRLSPPDRVNVSPDAAEMPDADAELVRRLTPVDRELWEVANRRLDQALATLPRLPPRPLALRRWELTMDQGIVGSGWSDRGEDPVLGWHRWTVPDRSSVVWPGVRLGGTVEIEIVAAASSEVAQNMQLSVQGRPVRHDLRPGSPGVVAHATATLDGDRPAEIAVRVPPAQRDTNPAWAERDQRTMAIRALRLTPVG
jgi:hypothetical protein